jgi:hypothetical protein
MTDEVALTVTINLDGSVEGGAFNQLKGGTGLQAKRVNVL